MVILQDGYERDNSGIARKGNCEVLRALTSGFLYLYYHSNIWWWSAETMAQATDGQSIAERLQLKPHRARYRLTPKPDLAFKCDRAVTG
jgi:hypothetical protein